MGDRVQLDWVNDWFDGVVSGESTMSQRKFASIAKRGGGIDAVCELARARGVHLLQLTDDKGELVVAASLSEFRVLS